MGAPVWKGSTELTKGQSVFSVTPLKWTLSVSFTGPFALCQSGAPAIAQALSGFPSTLLVTDVKTTQLDGGAGRLDIQAECIVSPLSFGTAAIGEAIYEDEWIELQKPIESHPRCGVLDPARLYWLNGNGSADGTTGGKRRTWDDWANLLGADNLPSGVTQVDYKKENAAGDDTDHDGFSVWTLAEYQSLKQSGTDSYLLFQPVLKRTTYHFSPPDDLGDLSGQTTTPPGAANFTHVSNYSWLQGADRCTRTKGIFCRTTEWQGFEPNGLTDLIYESA